MSVENIKHINLNSTDLQSEGIKVISLNGQTSGGEASNMVSSWQSTPDNNHYPSEKLVYDSIYPAVQTSQPASGMLPNILYTLGELSGTVIFALNTADIVSDITNHYYWTFDTGNTAPTVTWPTGLTWAGGSAPTPAANKHYEISILNNIAIALEV